MAKEWFKAFLKKIHNPPGIVVIITYLTTLIICPLTLIGVFFGKWKGVIAFFACSLGLALFTYMVIVSVTSFRRIKRKVLTIIDRHDFAKRLLKNYEFRTLFFSVGSFLFNVGYTFFLCIMGIMSKSTWYGVLAVYYILLTATRGGLLLDEHKNERNYKNDYWRLQEEKVGSYRYCGIMIVILTLALSVSVVEMVVNGAGFKVPTGLFFGFTAFAVFRIGMAVYNFVKATKYDDLTIRAARSINLTTALVSVLTFQTSLFAVYTPPINPVYLNAITGAIICLGVVALGIYMIVYSSRAKKLILKNNVHRQKLDFETGYNREDYHVEYGKSQENFPGNKA